MAKTSKASTEITEPTKKRTTKKEVVAVVEETTQPTVRQHRN